MGLFSFLPKRGLRLEVFGMTHKGLVRPNNEDNYLVDKDKGVFAVSDGMGGAASGEIASKLFIESVKKTFLRTIKNQEYAIKLIKKAFLMANEAILKYATTNLEHHGMGCTGELLVFLNKSYVIGHVGDSRTYLFRNKRLRQLTRDHTLVQDQVDKGLINKDEARMHPRRNVITRAIGISESLALDVLKGKHKNGDIFLICSDGLTSMVSDEEISKILITDQPIKVMVKALVNQANEAGGKDNITVILLKVF